MRSDHGGTDSAPFAAVAFAVALLVTLAAFALTRELRSADDLVNSVTVSPRVTPSGPPARIAFNLAEPDGDVSVEIIGREGERLRRLPGGGELPAGRRRFVWDGRDDSGSFPERGRYGIRVILGEAGRRIEPPGSIRLRGVEGEDGTGGA